MSVNDVYIQLRNAWAQSLPASPDQLFRTLAEVIEGDTPGGLGTMSLQNADAVAVTGGTLDGVTVGNTTAAAAVNATRGSNSPTGLQTTIDFNPTTGEPDTYLTAVYSGRVRRTGKITAAPVGFGNLTAPWRFAYEDKTSVANVNQSAVIAYMAATGNTASVTNNEEQSQRNAFMALIAVSGQFGSVNAPDPYIAFVGAQFETSFSSTQGGTGWPGGVTPAAPYLRGSGFGGNSLGIGRNGAINWTELMAHEFTISSQAGSSFGRKFGIHISKKPDDAVAALTGDEAAIVIASWGTIPWPKGLQFGWETGAGNWPFDTTSTLIGIKPQVYPVARDRSFRPLDIGIDLREATYTTAAIMWPGGYVDPSGNLVWTVPGAAPTLSANGQIALYAVSNTAVRIVYRGSDGTTRQSANIVVS